MGNRIASMVEEFHGNLRLAKALLDNGHGQEADMFLAQAAGRLARPSDLDRLFPVWLRAGRRGIGCESSLGYHGDNEALFWTVRFPDGDWDTVCCDEVGDDQMYWGGEIPARSLEDAVSWALCYQVKWPEAAVRVVGQSPDGFVPGALVLEIPPVW